MGGDFFSFILNAGQLLTGLTKAWLGNFGEIGHPSEGGAIPSGLIAMWSGASTAIPDGWLLCDGNNNTPDLRDRFIVGAGNSYTIGATGGEATHKLTTSEIPGHNHAFTGSSHTHTLTMSGLKTNSAGDHTHSIKIYTDSDASNPTSHEGYVAAFERRSHIHTTDSAGGHTHTISGSGSIGSSTAGGSIGYTGSGSAHENRPPYYALCFIMKQ